MEELCLFYLKVKICGAQARYRNFSILAAKPYVDGEVTTKFLKATDLETTL